MILKKALKSLSTIDRLSLRLEIHDSQQDNLTVDTAVVDV